MMVRCDSPGPWSGLSLSGVDCLAEVVAVALSWGLQSSYDSIFFAVYGITLTAVGALIVSRLPRHPVGWILCLVGC